MTEATQDSNDVLCFCYVHRISDGVENEWHSNGWTCPDGLHLLLERTLDSFHLYSNGPPNHLSLHNQPIEQTFSVIFLSNLSTSGLL